MNKIIHLDLFSGIGGFALALDNVYGKENTEHIFCDNEPFAQEVLKKHWPESKIYGDIRSLTADTEHTRYVASSGRHSGEESSAGRKKEQERALKSTRSNNRPFLLTGGFPCQPFSQAGRRRGEEDDRFLWPEMLRVIREFSPLWVIAENVRGLLTQGGGVVFERVCTDLEAAGYEVQPIIIPAVAVGAPHRRDRVWFIAHRRRQYGSEGRDERVGSSATIGTARESHAERRGEDVADTKGKRGERREHAERNSSRSEKGIFRREDWNRSWYEVALATCDGGVDDGIPRRMDRNPRLKALGNAIVPQVAEEVMRAIKNI